MPRTPWFVRLFGSPVRPIRNSHPKRRRSTRLGLLRLEERTVPAVLSATGTTLNVLLDTVGEHLDLTATTTSLRLETSGTFSGLASGTDTATFGTEYTDVRVTDAVAGTAVRFEDSGTNVYEQRVEIALSHGSAGVMFDGTSDFGDHPLAVSADSGITVSPGAVVRTGVAAITLDGNDTAGTGTGDFIGVDVEGSLTTADGAIRIAGRGGDAVGGSQFGIVVGSGAVVSAGGSGAVIATGTGGSGDGGESAGVAVFDGSTITAEGGAVTVTGTGGRGTGGDNYGVYLNGGTITAGGTGRVAVFGTGGVADGDFNIGVLVYGTSAVTSAGGAVSVTGAGGTGAGKYEYGVSVTAGGVVTAGGTGPVTVIGTGGNGGGERNYGVDVADGGQITSDGGAVSVTGTGGTEAGNGGRNHGVNVTTGGRITSAGSDATVTVTGTGGQSAGEVNVGVNVTEAGSAITSSGGDVTVTGTGGAGLGKNNEGLHLAAGGEISAGGTGAVAVDGTGGAGAAGGNYGVLLKDQDSTVTSAGGSVSVTGTGGSGDGGSNHGVHVVTGGRITSAGSDATVTVTGTGGSGAVGSNFGVYLRLGTAITSSGGDVTVTGTGGIGDAGSNHGVVTLGEMSSDGAGAVSITGTGGAAAHGYSIGVWADGSVTSGGGDVSVTGTGGSGDAFNYGVFATVGTITSGGSGAVTITGIGGHSSGASAAEVFGPPGGFTGGAGFGLNAGVTVCNFATITSGGAGAVTITGIGGTGGLGGSNGVGLNEGTITSGGGAVIITGTGGEGGLRDNGVVVGPEGMVTSGGGAVTITGTGGNSNPLHDILKTIFRGENYGVGVAGTVASGGGDVTVTGTGGDGQQSIGVQLDGTITSGGSGAVIVTGTGGLGPDSYGVVVNGTVTSGGPGDITVIGTGGGYAGVAVGEGGVFVDLGTIQSSGAGNITITGTAPDGSIGTGVFIGTPLDIFDTHFGVIAVNATGSGSISITGTAGHTGTGVILSLATISASGGDISITGTGDSQQASDDSVPAHLSGNQRNGVLVRGGAISTADAGNITITGQITNGAGRSNDGVLVKEGAQVIAIGTGAVTVTGTGGVGADSAGVRMVGGMLRSLQGDVVVTGTGRGGAGNNPGVNLAGRLIPGKIAFVTGTGAAGSLDVALDVFATIRGPGDVVVTADSLAIDTSDTPATIQAGAVGDGTVTIRTRTAGTQIDLGGPDVLTGAPRTLGLTVAELARIKAGVLKIGDPTNTGAITVSGAIDLSTFGEVHLAAAGPITESAGGSLTATNLGLTTTGGSVVFDRSGNKIGTVSASVGGAGNGFTLVADGGVAIGTVGGMAGLSAAGPIAVAADAIRLGADIRAGGGVFADGVVLAGDVTLTAAVRVEGREATFTNGVDGGFRLTVVTGKAATFAGAVGASNPLASLVVTGPATVNGGAMTTVGGQTFFGPVQVGRKTTFASTAGGDLTFAAALTGDHDVTADTAGATSFAGPVTVHSLTTRQPVVVVAGLPHGQVGAAFRQTLSASGPTGPYTFAVTGGTLSAGLSLSPAGVLSGTPRTSGSFTFTVTATNALRQTGSRLWTMTIAPAAAPSAPPVGTVPVGRDVQMATEENGPVTALVPVTEPTGRALTYGLVVTPVHGTVEFHRDGTFTYAPTANWSGTDGFVVRGTAADGASAQAGVTITVGALNDAPVIALRGLKTIVRENAAVRFTAVAVDADGPLSAIRFGLEGAPAGARIHPVRGVFNWAPTAAQGSRTYTFAVTATDGMAVSRTWVTLSVGGVNRPPTLTLPWESPAPTVRAGQRFAFVAAARDADLPAQALTYSLVRAPASAQINASTGAFTWTPSRTGRFTFRVRVSDGSAIAQKAMRVRVLPAKSPAGLESSALNQSGRMT